MVEVKHVGIILDGNRRFAKKLMLEPWKGHELGFEKAQKLFTWVTELGIKEMTLYCFSMQNFNRPKQEFDFLMDIFERTFKEALDDKRTHDNKIKMKIAGRLHLFPEKVQKAAIALQDATKDYSNYTVNFALGYGGREELIDAIKKIVEEKSSSDQITEEFIKNHLYISSEPEIIIRTGGDHRTSNFLPWQSIYSEWFFLDKTWPEFEKQDLIDVISEFGKRERRFGK